MCATYRTKDKGQKLKEVRQQQQFIQAVEDVEQWIREVELQLSSEDLGKDLTSVNNLLKKHMVCDYVYVCVYVYMCVFVSVSVYLCVCLHVFVSVWDRKGDVYTSYWSHCSC